MSQSIHIEKDINSNRPLKRSVFNYDDDNSNGNNILGIVLLLLGIIIDIILILLIIRFLFKKRITQEMKNDKNTIQYTRLNKVKVKTN